MRSLLVGITLLMALLMIGCSYVVIGKSIYSSFTSGNMTTLLFLVLVSIGTVLSLSRTLGGVIPAFIVIITVWLRQGIIPAIVTTLITGSLIAIGFSHSSYAPKQPEKPLVLYEWAASLAVSTFACVAVLLSAPLLPTRLFPVGAALLGGGLAICSDLLKSSALSEKQIKQLILFLSLGSTTLGIILAAFSPKPPFYS